MDTDKQQVNFETSYQDLMMIQGLESAIEAFTTAYETVLRTKAIMDEAMTQTPAGEA